MATGPTAIVLVGLWIHAQLPLVSCRPNMLSDPLTGDFPKKHHRDLIRTIPHMGVTRYVLARRATSSWVTVYASLTILCIIPSYRGVQIGGFFFVALAYSRLPPNTM